MKKGARGNFIFGLFLFMTNKRAFSIFYYQKASSLLPLAEGKNPIYDGLES